MNEWWKNEKFVEELDNRYSALETGEGKGFTIQQLEASIEKSRIEKYGK